MTRGEAQSTLRVYTWPDTTPVDDSAIVAAARAELAHWDAEIEALCTRFGFPKEATA